MSVTSLSVRVALALSLGSLTPALLAQEQLTREISFVRALAKEMRFIELAKSQVDALASEYRGAGDQDKIAQLAVEVAYYGARAKNDRTQQRALFKEAVEKSKELIERSNDEEVRLNATSTLANASQDFGQFLIEELEIARSEDPEKVSEIAEETAQVLRAGIDACKKVKEALSSQRDDEQKEIDYYLMWMKQAVLTREQARADKENRSVLVERAIEELTELVLDAGEETAIGLRGLFEIAQCYEVAGEIDEAVTYYTDTIDQIITTLNDADEGKLSINGEMLGFLFDMMQEVYVRAGETMAKAGAEGTAELFASFRENVAKFGEEGLDVFEVVSPSYGHLMLLAEAKFNAETGEPDKVQAGLAMAKKINDEHPADYVGVKAKAVLRDILALQQDLVSGALLFEVGKGELQNKNYEAAIKQLRKALPAMNTEEQKQFGLESYKLLGRAYGLTDRNLEAIYALAEGLQRFGVKEENARTDEQKQMAEVSSDVADTLDRTITLHKRQTKEDAFFTSFWAQNVELAAEYSSGGMNKLAFKEGNKLFGDKQYAEAAAKYQAITPEFLYYEVAKVRQARALAATGDYAGSRKAIAEYRKYVDETELNARASGKQQVRKAALASAAFNDVQMAYYEARGNSDFNLERDLAKYPAAIEMIQKFMTNFASDGEEYVPVVLAYLGRLHVDTGKMADAEAAYAQLKGIDKPAAARLATEIFKTYQDQVELMTKELDKAIAENKPDNELGAIRADIVEERKRLTALGMDYIKNSPQPQLAILVATMQAYEQLKDWSKVDEVAKTTLKLYGDLTEDQPKRVVDQLVRPMVGEALLQQQRFQEAYDMLVAAEKANPTQWELKRQIARALGGWFEVNDLGVGITVPGLDRPVEAYMKYYGDREGSYRIWATRPEVKPYSLEWYRFMWESFWFAKRAGLKNGQYKETADKFYRKARSTDDFASLKRHGEEGLELYRYFQANR